MLNIELIQTAMRRLGLSQSALAQACDVSKEAVSKWLANESLPRPRKLSELAERLGVTVDQLLGVETTPEPVVAYRTRQNKKVTGAAHVAGTEVGWHLRELLPYTTSATLFEPPVLRDPQLDEGYIQRVASAVRESLGVAPTDTVSRAQLLELFHDFGAYLVPVFWGGDKDGHENAMSVYLPDTKASWVVFNLGCRQDDFKYWLAHEYGHCLTLHSLREEEGESFAETFAQHLLFPDEMASQALRAIKTAKDKKEGLAAATWFAGKSDISVITVVRAADRVARLNGESETGLATTKFYIDWQARRRNEPTMAKVLFDTDTPSMSEYVSKCESIFRTPVFKALGAYQRNNGGRSPAFISSALNVDIGHAVELSKAL